METHRIAANFHVVEASCYRYKLNSQDRFNHIRRLLNFSALRIHIINANHEAIWHGDHGRALSLRTKSLESFIYWCVGVTVHIGVDCSCVRVVTFPCKTFGFIKKKKLMKRNKVNHPLHQHFHVPGQTRMLIQIYLSKSNPLLYISQPAGVLA